MERLWLSVYWYGAILFGSALTNGYAVRIIFSHLCRFCDVRLTACNATGSCLSDCNISSICKSRDEVCVAAWHRDGEKTTVETVCHDPSLPFRGIMLDDYNSTECVMKQKKALGSHFYVCSCTGEECNDELIFTPVTAPPSDAVPLVPVILLSLPSVLLLVLLIISVFYCYRVRFLHLSRFRSDTEYKGPAHRLRC